MMIPARAVLVLVSCLVLTCFCPLRAQDITIYLLGTGGPELTEERQGAATLVVANGQDLLFDAGRGVMQRLYESGVRIADLDEVFLTHLHSDHIEGLPNLWMSGWFLLGRLGPMDFHGPVGTLAMVHGMQAFFGHDMVARVQGTDTPGGLRYTVEEFERDGVVYERAGVRVSAFAVDHKDGNPAFGYRIDFKGRSVVLSGDCTYSKNLVDHARGVDVVVHNVFAVSAPILAHNPNERIVALKLASPEQVAAVMLETRPRMAALSHVIRIGLRDGDVIDRIRAAGYQGPLEMGLDRMVIEVGDRITVKPPQSLDGFPDAVKPGDR
jgi:ribonuclease Z